MIAFGLRFRRFWYGGTSSVFVFWSDSPFLRRSQTMSHQEQLYQWNQTLARHLPNLSKPQAHCLALWTFGMVLARSCSLSAVVAVLAALLGHKQDNLRQRLREFYKEAPKKAG